jgi:hypothetical protein
MVSAKKSQGASRSAKNTAGEPRKMGKPQGGPHYPLDAVLAPNLETSAEQYAVYLQNYRTYTEYVRDVRTERCVAKKGAVLEKKQRRQEQLAASGEGSGEIPVKNSTAEERLARRRRKRNVRRKLHRKAMRTDIERTKDLKVMKEQVLAKTELVKAKAAYVKAVSKPAGSLNAKARRSAARKKRFGAKGKGKKTAGGVPARAVKRAGLGKTPNPVGNSRTSAKSPEGKSATKPLQSGERVIGSASMSRDPAYNLSLEQTSPNTWVHPPARTPARTTVVVPQGPPRVERVDSHAAALARQPPVPEQIQTPFTICPHGKSMVEPCRACLRKINNSY